MFYRINELEFDDMYSIMKKSFPDDEYRDYGSQKKVFENPVHEVFGWKYNDNLIAFITLWHLSSYIFAEHLAVDEKYRDQGTGSELLRQVKLLYGKPMCLEVELPENEMSRRRIGFYKRNGFYLNNFDYTQPPISEGKKPVPLLLMTTGSFLNKDNFEKLRSEIMLSVYGIKLPTSKNALQQSDTCL